MEENRSFYQLLKILYIITNIVYFNKILYILTKYCILQQNIECYNKIFVSLQGYTKGVKKIMFFLFVGPGLVIAGQK